MSKPKHCLNCNAVVEDNFCKYCGQSESTHRFTLKHVFGHDFLHAMFHFGGGFFYTLKELFTRPGHSVREYVAGKRVKHLNYFSFIVVSVLFFSGAEAITDFNYTESDADSASQHVAEVINETLKHHAKMVFIGILPLLALTTLLMFRKAGQNFAEHFVVNTYKQSAILLLNVFFVLLASQLDHPWVIVAEHFLSVLSMSYGIWFYYQYFSPFYTRKLLLLFRVILAAFIPLLVVMLVLGLYLALQAS